MFFCFNFESSLNWNVYLLSVLDIFDISRWTGYRITSITASHVQACFVLACAYTASLAFINIWKKINDCHPYIFCTITFPIIFYMFAFLFNLNLLKTERSFFIWHLILWNLIISALQIEYATLFYFLVIIKFYSGTWIIQN